MGTNDAVLLNDEAVEFDRAESNGQLVERLLKRRVGEQNVAQVVHCIGSSPIGAPSANPASLVPSSS